jgi:micrococcal nuclease
MRTARAVVLIALWLWAGHDANAAEILTGKVVRIADGDTLTLLVDREQVKIRLYGIDAPEKAQPFGNRAKQALSELTFGKSVRVEAKGKDKYKRTLGRVFVDDTDVNLELVKRGMAWWYRHYAPKDKELAQAEEEARRAKRGLWADAKPIPPWEWRKGRRE